MAARGRVEKYERRDPRYYANPETNLFPLVYENFHRSGMIDPIDFLAIVSWKANRAKSKIIARLTDGDRTFSTAVLLLSRDLSSQNSDEKRLRLLMEGWGLRLPIATAILAVLFPENFTIYDWRVCEELEASGLKTSKGKSFKTLGYAGWRTTLFQELEEYKKAVLAEAPKGFSLRQADHHLWGRSWVKYADEWVSGRRNSQSKTNKNF